MRIAICDDDTIISGRIENIVRSCTDMTSLETEVYLSGPEIIAAVKAGNLFQIYLLDVMMPEQDGFDVARQIRQQDKQALIIFITSNHDMMQDAFDVRAFHYLLKEESDCKIESIIRRAITYVCEKQTFFTYRKLNKEYVVKNESILYFESQKRKMRIFTTTGSDEFYDTVEHVFQNLNPLFFARIHKSFIVNLEHVEMLENNRLLLQDGTELFVTANYKSDFNTKYRNYIINQME